jgi:hypothetical protein
VVVSVVVLVEVVVDVPPVVVVVAWFARDGSLVTVLVIIIGLYPGADTTPP